MLRIHRAIPGAALLTVLAVAALVTAPARGATPSAVGDGMYDPTGVVAHGGRLVAEQAALLDVETAWHGIRLAVPGF